MARRYAAFRRPGRRRRYRPMYGRRKFRRFRPRYRFIGKRRNRRRKNSGGVFGGKKVLGLGTNGFLKMGPLGAVLGALGAPAAVDFVGKFFPQIHQVPFKTELAAGLIGGPAGAAGRIALNATGIDPLKALGGAGGTGF